MKHMKRNLFMIGCLIAGLSITGCGKSETVDAKAFITRPKKSYRMTWLTLYGQKKKR